MATKTRLDKDSEAALKKSVNAKIGSDYEHFSVYKGHYTSEELQLVRRTLAKRANQRLVRLSRSVSEVTGEAFSSYGAAEIVFDYIEDKRPGKIRFDERFGYNAGDLTELKDEIMALQKFLTSKSSTVKGQREIERARIKTFKLGDWGSGDNKEIPSWIASNKAFYDFLKSETVEQLVKAGFTSDDIVDVYVIARETDSAAEHDDIMDKLAKALEDYQNKRSKVSLKDLRSRVLAGSGSK